MPSQGQRNATGNRNVQEGGRKWNDGLFHLKGREWSIVRSVLVWIEHFSALFLNLLPMIPGVLLALRVRSCRVSVSGYGSASFPPWSNCPYYENHLLHPVAGPWCPYPCSYRAMRETEQPGYSSLIFRLPHLPRAPETHSNRSGPA